MAPHVAIDRDRLEAFCRKWNVKELSFFGSVLSDDFRPDSDVDVLVEFTPGQTPGLEIVDLEEEFSRLLGGRRVDLVNPKYLNPRLKTRVLAEAELLYAQG